MTQGDVLNFLSHNKTKWFTSNMIAKELGIGMSAATSNLKKLRKYDTTQKRRGVLHIRIQI